MLNFRYHGFAISRRRFHGGVLALAATLTFGVFAFAAVPAVAAAPTAPAIASGAVTTITTADATLNGSVNPNGAAATVYFQYGSTNKYGAQTPSIALAAETTSSPVTATLTGLSAGTSYHYRLVASNSAGTTTGSDHVFLTAVVPLSVVITPPTPTSATFGSSFVLSGSVSGTDSANAEVQLQANPWPYTAGFQDVDNPELTFSDSDFGFNIINATVNTQYRVVAGAATSQIVTVNASLAVSAFARVAGSRAHPLVIFTGVIAPAEPGVALAIEYFNGSKWVVVGGGLAGAGTGAPAGSVSSSVTYTLRYHTHHSGEYRVLALTGEASHVHGYSATVSVAVR